MPGIEIISTLIFSTLQLGFGGWQLTRRDKFTERIGRSHYLALTLLFFLFNLSGLLQFLQVPYVKEATGLLLGIYFFYFLALRMFPASSTRTSVILCLGGAMISCFFVLVFYPFSPGNIHLGIIVLVPVLLTFYLILALMISLMGKLNTPSVDTGRQAKIFAQLFFIIPLSGALLIDIRMPGIQLTVNMIFLIFASEYVLRVQRVGGGNMTLLWEPVSQKLQSIEDSEPVNPLLFYGLTVSEMEVAELVLQGKTAPEIAEELGRKTGAIHQHMSHIYRKTNTRSAQEFVVKMLRNPSEFGENSENSEI